MFLEQPISRLEWFLKGHVTLKTGVMMLKIQLFITWLNYILKYTIIENILNSTIISQYYGFEFFFFFYKCSIGGQKRLSKTWKIIILAVAYLGKVCIDLSSDEHSLTLLLWIWILIFQIKSLWKKNIKFILHWRNFRIHMYAWVCLTVFLYIIKQAS